jgi:hypothetical protein
MNIGQIVLALAVETLGLRLRELSTQDPKVRCCKARRIEVSFP